MNEELLTLHAKTIIGYIADAAWRWCNPDYPPRVRTLQALVERTGYSAPVIEYAIDSLMSGLTREALCGAIENELGSLDALDTFIERDGRPQMHAQPRGKVVILSSRTTIGVAIPSAVFALATKNSVVVKDREDGFVRAFFATLAQEHPAFARAAIAQPWSDDHAEKLADADADVVVAFGSDETLTAIRAALPATIEFVGFGSRISCGYLSRSAIKSPAPLRHALEQAARDIVLYDAEGCMSLHVLFVEIATPEDEQKLPAIAQNLAQAVAAATVEFPPSRQEINSRLTTAAVRATHSFRAAQGKSVGAHAGPATVIIDRDVPPPLRPMTTLLVPVSNETEVAPYLQRHGLRVETLAVEHADINSITLSRMIGAHRITTFGAMQNPDLAGDHGGRSRIHDFVSLIDLETSDTPIYVRSNSDDPSNHEDPSNHLESIVTEIPGPRSLHVAVTLATYEAQGITYLADDFPVAWESAKDALVTDVDGNRYIDCTSAFGVASVGHGNAHVVAAIAAQAKTLMHGMGDVHPSAVRASYLERLSHLAPGDLERCFLGANGADAVEFALKTAFLKTGKPSVLHFEGAYHGLSYGTLAIAGIDRFRTPFLAQLHDANPRLPYPTQSVSCEAALAQVETVLQQHADIGAVIIEPIAGRAGTLIPVPGFLPGLRALADRFDIVLIFDEIYTGFGRTGTWFACEDEDVVPDILCVGKAIAGGFPLSAAIGNDRTFSAWPRSTGEAIHTSTYLGNPMACAAAHAVLDQFEMLNLVERSYEMGIWFGMRLAKLAHRISERIQISIEVRGRGMMWALDLGDQTLAVRSTVHALHRGLIVLPQGLESTAIALTPPLVVTKEQLTRAVTLLEDAIVSAHAAL